MVIGDFKMKIKNTVNSLSKATIIFFITNLSFKLFIVAFSLILLFLISCSADDKTGSGENKGGNHSKSELVGTWTSSELLQYRRGDLRIFTTGWIGLAANGKSKWTSVGKLDDTFDYPYTVEIIPVYQPDAYDEVFLMKSI